MDPDVLSELRSTVRSSASLLRGLTDEEASMPSATGGWSAKELIGHLIDSASNNHQRFVRAAFSEDLVFPGYDQDAWVGLQQPGEVSWDLLVTLFESFNLYLADVLAKVPVEAIRRERDTHNLDQIAWEVVPRSEAVTLDYFVRDYVGHLKHHLHHLDERLADAPIRQRD